MLFIPQGTIRASYNDKTSPHRKFAVLFSVDSSSTFPLPKQPLHIDLQSFAHARERITHCYHIGLEKQPYYEWSSQAILMECLSLLLRESTHPPLSRDKQRIAQTVREYVLEHFREL